MARSTLAPSTEEVNWDEDDQHSLSPGRPLMASSSRHLPHHVLKMTAKNCGCEARFLRRTPRHGPQGPYLSFAAGPHFSKDETPHRSWPRVLMAHLTAQHQTKSTKRPRPTKVHPPNPAPPSDHKHWIKMEGKSGVAPKERSSKNFSQRCSCAHTMIASPKAKMSSSSVCK